MTGRDLNQALAQHAAELGLEYTPDAIRKLRSRMTDAAAREHMQAVAALLAFADHVFIQDAAVPFTQQQATQTLNRAAGDYEKAQVLVERRARYAFATRQRKFTALYECAWRETVSKEARERHARLTGAYEPIPGTLGHRFTAVMGFLADADLPRDRYRIAAAKEVGHALQNEFPHHIDRGVKEQVLRRYPDLGRQIDYFERKIVFRARIEDLIAEACEHLAERVQDGWTPNPARVVEVERLLRLYWGQWRKGRNRTWAKRTLRSAA